MKLSDCPVETIVDDAHAAIVADILDIVDGLRDYAPWCVLWDLDVIGRADNPDDPSNDGHLNMSFMSLAMVGRLTVPPSYVPADPIRAAAHELAHLVMAEFNDWAANVLHTLEACTEANASIAGDFFHDVEERTCWRIADGIVAGFTRGGRPDATTDDAAECDCATVEATSDDGDFLAFKHPGCGHDAIKVDDDRDDAITYPGLTVGGFESFKVVDDDNDGH